MRASAIQASMKLRLLAIVGTQHRKVPIVDNTVPVEVCPRIETSFICGRAVSSSQYCQVSIIYKAITVCISWRHYHYSGPSWQ